MQDKSELLGESPYEIFKTVPWICNCPEQRQTFAYLNPAGIELAIATAFKKEFEAIF